MAGINPTATTSQRVQTEDYQTLRARENSVEVCRWAAKRSRTAVQWRLRPGKSLRASFRKDQKLSSASTLAGQALQSKLSRIDRERRVTSCHSRDRACRLERFRDRSTYHWG